MTHTKIVGQNEIITLGNQSYIINSGLGTVS